MTKVSIITISYNNAKGLQRTIESVVSQNFDDYEYIVIDGGSSDGSKDIIESFSDKITYWVSESDGGVYHAMNKGIAVARGQYLHFLNSGDIYAANDVLSTVFSKEYDEPLLRTVQICDYGNRQEIWTNLGSRDVTLYDMYVNTMLHQATFIHRSMFEKYGLYDENLKIVSDWKFFLQTILDGEKTRYLHIRSIVFEMYGLSTSTLHGELHLKERRQVLDELMPPNAIADYERLKSLEHSAYISDLIKSNRFYMFIFKIFNKINKSFGKKN